MSLFCVQLLGLSALAASPEPGGPWTEGNLIVDKFPTTSRRPAPPLVTVTPPLPLEDTFFLHSLPDADHVLYLDFDGHVVTAGGGESFTYVGWDFDGDPEVFSDDELAIIQLSWQALVEDFRPFNLDVTTEYPGQEALKKTSDDDTEWGIRVVVNQETYDYSWAYVDSFNSPFDVEMYAWSGNFEGDIDETWLWIADSVNHEAGHALGLQHHGTTTGQEYYQGHGEGEVAWSPIMGWSGYGLSQWSKGEYTLANNSGQDDLEIITTQNGFGYREDDHGETLSTATELQLGGLNQGVIERVEDVDAFLLRLDVPGAVSLQAAPEPLNPNLDILLTVVNELGEVLASSNPDELLAASLDLHLDAGDYLVVLEGVGRGAVDGDGYSDYGSLGYFQLVASVDDDIDTGPEDTEPGDTDTAVQDSDSASSNDTDPPNGEPVEGCGCGSTPSSGAALSLLGFFGLLLIRRRGESEAPSEL
ncbi:MAG: serralysin [Cognaticolwellia sp.]